MRTTLVLPDDLLTFARRRAADTGQTLSDVVAGCIRDALVAPPPTPSAPFRMVTFGGKRGRGHQPADFARLLDEDDRAGLGR